MSEASAADAATDVSAGDAAAAPSRALMLLVAATAFMEILDGTILANAAPAIARTFSVPSGDLSLPITAYLITLAVLIPVSGWLCDRWGTRTVFVAAIAVFTVASAACAASTSLGELAALRVVQGAGAAMMVPVGRLVVLRGTARSALVRAVAFVTWPALVAPIVAPLAGGWIVSVASWRWIFLVNVPLGLLALIAAVRLVPQHRTRTPTQLDWSGFVLCTGCSSAVVLAADALGRTHVIRGWWPQRRRARRSPASAPCVICCVLPSRCSICDCCAFPPSGWQRPAARCCA